MSGGPEVYWTGDVGEGWEREESRLVILIGQGS